jgi:hypothetical protein
LDINNDRRLDLFFANGLVDDRPWANSPMAQTAQLFLGESRGRFALASPTRAAYLDRPVVGRGVAAGDLNNDGRVDLVVVNRDAPVAYLQNMEKGGHSLGLRLLGTKSSRTPVGSRVTCRAGGRETVRWLPSGTSYLSASDPRVWFGLGDAREVEQLEIVWPAGQVQRWSHVRGDRIVTVSEGSDSLVNANVVVGER